jgi:shikimate dehydrogenase
MFTNYELDKIEDIIPIVINTKNLLGFAVTKPYKQQIIKYLDEYDKDVSTTHSCNCVLIKNHKLIGYNTDIIGFEQSFTTDLKHHHTKALVLGNGGAAQAIKFVLRKLHIHYTLVTRAATPISLQYEQVDQSVINDHSIIINTTPIGTFPNTNECPIIPYQYLTAKHYLFDLVYNPSTTSFMNKGLQQNTIVKNGYEMLCIQAEANWKIWNA